MKNIDLSEKLANFIATHPEEVKDLPKNASFVTFSFTDESLNNENTALLKSLLEEGRQVVKAEETNDKKNPWIFTPVTA